MEYRCSKGNSHLKDWCLNPSRAVFVCVLMMGFALCGSAYAQSTLNMGLNVSTGFKGFEPNGKRGTGANMEYIHPLWKNGGVRASVGYEWFDYRRPKNIPYRIWLDSLIQHPTRFQDISFLPVRIGFEQFIFQEYACLFAEAGMAVVNPSRLKAKSVFSFSIGAGGYRLPIKKGRYIQLFLSYNYNNAYKYNKWKILPNHNYLSFAIMYGLRFKKNA